MTKVSNPHFDGLACACGRDLAVPGARSVPIGFGPDGQIFQCAPETGCQEVIASPLHIGFNPQDRNRPIRAEIGTAATTLTIAEAEEIADGLVSLLQVLEEVTR